MDRPHTPAAPEETRGVGVNVLSRHAQRGEGDRRRVAAVAVADCADGGCGGSRFVVLRLLLLQRVGESVEEHCCTRVSSQVRCTYEGGYEVDGGGAREPSTQHPKQHRHTHNHKRTCGVDATRAGVAQHRHGRTVLVLGGLHQLVCARCGGGAWVRGGGIYT